MPKASRSAVSVQASKTSKDVKTAPGRAIHTAKSAVPIKPQKVERETKPDQPTKALKEFDLAVELFNSGEFKEAKKRFEHLAEGSAREIAYSAKLHARMCEQRMARKEVRPMSADECYHYGIALLNEKKLDEARQQFEKALTLTPDADHIHYAFALCLGLRGELTAAHQHLWRAIELQPRNRSIARNDPDFAELCRKPPLNELLSRK